MIRSICLCVLMMAAAPSLQAESMFSWLENKASSPSHTNHAVNVEVDQASLLTLEPGESEMHPKISPDGRFMLVVSGKKRAHIISRRLLENGDPLNVVTDSDPQQLDSIAWHGNDAVYFLSHRADSLGVWQKPVEGGVVRRLFRLDGELRSPIILPNGAMLAVRLFSNNRSSSAKKKSVRSSAFDNWTLNRTRSHLVHINADGLESDLTSGINPALSPDGKRVVFSMQAGRSWHLFIMNVDGSGLMQLSEGRSIDVQPSWSPDGKWIAFTSNRADADMRNAKKGNWDIWLIAADGDRLTRLTWDKGRDGAAEIASNGRVYFHSDRKVSKADRKLHQVGHNTDRFHIWSLALPVQ